MADVARTTHPDHLLHAKPDSGILREIFHAIAIGRSKVFREFSGVGRFAKAAAKTKMK